MLRRCKFSETNEDEVVLYIHGGNLLKRAVLLENGTTACANLGMGSLVAKRRYNPPMPWWPVLAIGILNRDANRVDYYGSQAEIDVETLKLVRYVMEAIKK